jgi:PAS domain S-box-containing protein
VTPELQITLLESGVHIASALVFAAVLRYFEQREGRTYLRFWILSWVAFALYALGSIGGRVMALNMPPTAWPRLTVSVLSLAFAYLQAMWLLLGSYEFTRRARLRGAWELPTVAVALVIGLGLTLLWINDPDAANRRYIVRVGLRAIVVTLAFVAAAFWTFIERGHRRGAASVLLPAALFVYGIDQAAGFYLAQATTPSGPSGLRAIGIGYGYFDIFAQLLIGLGMLLWMLEQARAERQTDWQRLADSEERYRTLVESAPDAILTVDTLGFILFCNSTAAAMFGYDMSELAGMRLDTLVPGEQARVLTSGDEGWARPMPWTALNISARHRSGRTFDVEVSLTEHMHGRERRVTGIVRDVSDRQRMEAQLLHAQKMEAVGRLTGGIAHDFNNLLTAIGGYAEISLPQLHCDDPLFARLTEIRRAAERASDLTRKLMAFSRKQTIQSKRFDLNKGLADLAPILRRLIGEDVAVTIATSNEPLAIHADVGQIDQVLLNLAVNARDAMPTGGRLTLSTEAITIDEPVGARHPEARPGNFACVHVVDTGMGIAAKDLPHIFEPFFTTKEHDRGTGLGLAITYGVVHQHGGWVEVGSEVGRGTRFSVFLPLTGGVDATADVVTTVGVSLGGTETVLLVEDEEPVRLILSEALSNAGYTVIECGSGPEALTAWEAYGDRVQLLLCDVVLPDGISGFDLSVKLTQARPGLRVLLMSGYQEHAAAPIGAMFLAKPFSLEHMLATVRRCLDGVEVVTQSK